MGSEVRGYVVAKGGFVTNATKESIGNAQIAFGGKVTGQNGYYTKAEVGYGNAFQANVEVGKKFELANNFDIETSVGGQYFQTTNKSNYYKAVFEENINLGPTWKPNDLRGYANAGVNFKGKWGNVGLGVQGGVKHSSKSELPPEGLDETIGLTRGTEITGKKTKAYVTPTVTTKINMGKCWSFNADVSLEQGSIGIAYNF